MNIHPVEVWTSSMCCAASHNFCTKENCQCACHTVAIMKTYSNVSLKRTLMALGSEIWRAKDLGIEEANVKYLVAYTTDVNDYHLTAEELSTVVASMMEVLTKDYWSFFEFQESLNARMANFI